MNRLAHVRVRHFRSVRDASLGAVPPAGTPPVLFLPAELRAGTVVAPSAHASAAAEHVASLLRPQVAPHGRTLPAVGVVDGIRSCCAFGIHGVLARAAILVEGRTEKLVFPFVFEALGHDADGEAISIVECGGKGNLPLFIDICKAVRVPYVVVHDRDAAAGSEPIAAEAALNEVILAAAGADRVVVLEPDLERVAGIRGRSHKPERAWRRFAGSTGDVPEPLERAVRLALALARD